MPARSLELYGPDVWEMYEQLWNEMLNFREEETDEQKTELPGA